MDRMLMQTELTVIAGDHESYSISATEQKLECQNLQERILTIEYLLNIGSWVLSRGNKPLNSNFIDELIQLNCEI